METHEGECGPDGEAVEGEEGAVDVEEVERDEPVDGRQLRVVDVVPERLLAVEEERFNRFSGDLNHWSQLEFVLDLVFICDLNHSSHIESISDSSHFSGLLVVPGFHRVSMRQNHVKTL